MPRLADVDSTWDFIASGVDIIMVQDISKGAFTSGVYMSIYTAIHNFCVTTHLGANNRPNSHVAQSREHHTQLLGGELYCRLSEYLKHHLSNIVNGAATLEDEELLDYYNNSWQRYVLGAKYLDHIFSYLNRHWVKHQRDEAGRKSNVHEVNTLCLVLWRDHMFMALKDKIIAVLLDQIKRHRDGEIVAIHRLKEVITSLVEIGLDDQNNKRSSLVFYSTNFEKPFLDATREYYTREAKEFSNNHGVVAYMRRVYTRLQEEQQRVNFFLYPLTEEKLLATCEEVLIKNSAEIMQNEFLGLLAANRDDDCRILYKLLCKVPNGLVPIERMLQQHVESQGAAAMQTLVAESKDGNPDPRSYIETLLQVYEHYNRLVKGPLENSVGLSKAVEKGIRILINDNIVARPIVDEQTQARALQSRTAELLARFSDSLLKKSSRNADFNEIDKSLDDIIQILRFVDEKDAFEKHYSRLLSRRLVHQTSANPDLEASMVNRLGDLCGFETTSKLQRMFQDMTTSTELQSKFHETRLPNEPDFNPYVLAEGFWPLPYRNITFNLPDVLKPAYDRFIKLYSELHNARRLKWLCNFGKAEVKMNFGKSRTPHILMVSLFQMAILLPFNTQQKVTIEEIQEITGLPDTIISQSLSYIVKAHVLLQEPPDAPVGSFGTFYTVNENFKSKKIRINLNLPLKLETRQEVIETERQIEEDRRMYLQAIMVRIMKARRELSHAQLVQETIQLARKRFQPHLRDIKRCIAALIEKDYLKRTDDEETRYEYLA